MQFWEYKSSYSVFKKENKAHDGKGNYYPRPDISANEYYKLVSHQVEGSATGVLLFEDGWHERQKPYYNIYPSIVNMLTKIDLEKIRFGSINTPEIMSHLLVRFSVGNELDEAVRSIGLSVHERDGDKYFVMAMDVGATHKYSNTAALSCPVFGKASETIGVAYNRLYDNKTIIPKGITKDTVLKALKLTITLCLLGDSPELIQPEVLNADEHKLTGQHNIEALVAKARRRGKYGFTIGKDIEVIPHYRRPHLALVWYGKGKKKSKIIPRKGSIVHRAAVEKVPTGYGVDEL